jgi:membrane protein
MPAAFAFARALYAESGRHNLPRLAAAISYFALFSIAPLIVVIVEIGGFVLAGHARIRAEIFGLLAHDGSPAVAAVVRQLVDSAFANRGSSLLSQTVGWTMFVAGALNFFGSLQDALNVIWDVEPAAHAGLAAMVRARALSFGLILGLSLLVLVLLAVDSIAGVRPQGAAAGYAGAFLVEFLLFAAIFKVLPDAPTAWSEVWAGAAISALLFGAGQAVLGWYLARPALSSAYGAFGSIVVLLLWIDYSALIVLLGAQVTRVLAPEFEPTFRRARTRLT